LIVAQREGVEAGVEVEAEVVV
jgi:hypothetical protein